jgi:hypothetical protein
VKTFEPPPTSRPDRPDRRAAGARGRTSPPGPPAGPPRRLAATPRDPFHRRKASADQAVAATIVAFLVAALLGSDALVGLARRQPFGWQRSLELGVAQSVDRVADRAGLDRPVRGARRLLGKEHATYDVDALVNPAAAPAPAAPGAGASPPPTTEPTRRVPTGADPLRVYVGGDSMAREVGNGLAQAAPADLSSVDDDYRVSTGLSRPDFFDWPERLAQVITERRPDVFVLIFGTNDSQDVQGDSGVLQAGSPAWLDVYRARVAKVMDLLHQPATTTVWVGLPAMRSHDFDTSMAGLDAVYREEAARRPWITYVDSRSLFAPPSGGSSGAYTDTLPTAGGGEEAVRQEDGIHWSVAGATRIGRAAWAAIARQWSLPAG